MRARNGVFYSLISQVKAGLATVPADSRAQRDELPHKSTQRGP